MYVVGYALLVAGRLRLTECHAVVWISRGCSTAADIIVMCATWKTTFKQWREGRKLKMPLSISSCLLRDGKCSCHPFRSVELTRGLILGTMYFLYVSTYLRSLNGTQLMPGRQSFAGRQRG